MTTPKLGEGTCQCAACGLCFTSTGTFDKHRAWDGDQRICREPRDVGLVLNARGCYGGPPMTDEQKARMGWTR